MPSSGPLGALADEPRLRVFAALLLDGPLETDATAARAGIPLRDALRHLSRLESAGLVVREGESWAARPATLREAVAAAAPAADLVDHGASDPEEAQVLRTFLPDGRLTQIPAARGKRLVVLEHIAMAFEPGVRYPEREVNAMLRAFHPDYAALRRYLIDEGLMTRDFHVYWRSGGRVVLD